MLQVSNLLLQRAELAGGQDVAEAARAAVREERDVAVAQAEDARRRRVRAALSATCTTSHSPKWLPPP